MRLIQIKKMAGMQKDSKEINSSLTNYMILFHNALSNLLLLVVFLVFWMEKYSETISRYLHVQQNHFWPYYLANHLGLLMFLPFPYEKYHFLLCIEKNLSFSRSG